LIVYLTGSASRSERDEVARALQTTPGFRKVSFESKDEAYARYERLCRKYPELLASIDRQEVPASFRVTVASGKDLVEKLRAIEVHPAVGSTHPLVPASIL
jgi:cell division transport system permease protein